MFKILIVIFDMFLLSSKFMDVTISIVPFTTPFDISMFLVMRTKAPTITFFYMFKMGIFNPLLHIFKFKFISNTTTNISFDVNNF